MQIFRIVQHGSKWFIPSPDGTRILVSSPERESLVRMACAHLRTHGGEVRVYDENGRLIEGYAYAKSPPRLVNDGD